MLALPGLAQQFPGTGLLADPASRAYYLYAASNPAGDEVVAYKSTDLAKWDGPSPVFRLPEGSWANPAQGIRNPEVHVYRGRYYLFATLGNQDQIIAKPPESWRLNTRRGTQIFVSDSPLGPFAAVAASGNESQTPRDFVAADGTLYREGDLPYLVYVHDWSQQIDATIEAVRMRTDLSAPVEEALHLFKSSDAPWLRMERATSRNPRYYVGGGPCLWRTSGGGLVMLWSSLRGGKPAVAAARSVTGKVRGPWRQVSTLLTDSGPQMSVFRAFDGRLMLMVQRPPTDPKPGFRLLELEDTGASLRIKP